MCRGGGTYLRGEELISVWEDMGAYLRGGDMQGEYIIGVQKRGSM